MKLLSYFEKVDLKNLKWEGDLKKDLNLDSLE
jgi:hypothetical protein